MTQDMENLILSGKFFSTSRSSSPSRSPSRSRSPSPDPLWPNEGNSSDTDLPEPFTDQSTDVPNGTQSVGMIPGRTGVKGVIRDHNEAMNSEQAKLAQHIKETNRRMEKMALNARTYAEDEAERTLEKQRQDGRGADGELARRRIFERSGWFGHLREVGMAGFLDAIENEMNETWVLIHIYDPSLSRCHDLDAVLARLARQYPQTKFLRARASAVDFFSSAYPRRSTKPEANTITISEDTYLDNDNDFEEDPSDTIDMEMLPTLLAYRAGELVHTWVRVDWEVEKWTKGDERKSIENIEALLQDHHVIQPLGNGNGNCGFSSDDDDLDLQFAHDDNDDELFDL